MYKNLCYDEICFWNLCDKNILLNVFWKKKLVCAIYTFWYLSVLYYVITSHVYSMAISIVLFY